MGLYGHDIVEKITLNNEYNKILNEDNQEIITEGIIDSLKSLKNKIIKTKKKMDDENDGVDIKKSELKNIKSDKDFSVEITTFKLIKRVDDVKDIAHDDKFMKDINPPIFNNYARKTKSIISDLENGKYNGSIKDINKASKFISECFNKAKKESDSFIKIGKENISKLNIDNYIKIDGKRLVTKSDLESLKEENQDIYHTGNELDELYKLLLKLISESVLDMKKSADGELDWIENNINRFDKNVGKVLYVDVLYEVKMAEIEIDYKLNIFDMIKEYREKNKKMSEIENKNIEAINKSCK